MVTVSAADTPIGPPGDNLEDRLDEAIQETFPASDPIATCIEDEEVRPGSTTQAGGWAAKSRATRRR